MASLAGSEQTLSFANYRYLVFSDLYRIACETKRSGLIHRVVFGELYSYIFWMRTCRFLRGNKFLKYSLYPFARFMLNHYHYKLCITIPFSVDIGPGFYIGHFGDIVISPKCKIGKNCNISQGVTLGVKVRGKHVGYPTIGDNVYIAPGAKIIGAIHVGDDVAIGANCVVTDDVPDHAVVVGVPGKVISLAGSEGYVCNTDYEDKLC